MIFKSIRLAQKKAALISEAHPKTRFENIKLYVISPFMEYMLKDMHIPRELIEKWMARLKLQQGYKFKNKTGKEVKIVIEPFENGYVCWTIKKDGVAKAI